MFDEKTLISQARSGDSVAFQQLIELSLPKLKTLLSNQYKKLSAPDIDDIVQIASVKAWQNLHRFRSESSFITWFYIILRNEAINFINKRGKIERHELPAHHVSQESEDSDYDHILHSSLDDALNETALTIIERREILAVYRQIIAEVLTKLKPAHSQVIRMVLEEGKSHQEIADELNIPVGTVMSRLFWARKHAQKLINQYAIRHECEFPCIGRR